MFTAQKAMFLYAVSPVHMGAGTAIGLIDNPIQREAHTQHPMVAGSGLKGAIRHRLAALHPDQRSNKIARYFGPEAGNSSDHAGAVSFSDAQLVLFPVRSLKKGFVYATSPLALARLQRLLSAAGVDAAKGWKISDIEPNHCKIINPDLLSGNNIQVDAFELAPKVDKDLKGIADWLAANALPQDDAYSFFREKMSNDLVMMSDDEFGYFVRNATLVEPHVRIDSEKGTADKGGLFYTENLPPESLLASVALASDERSKMGKTPAREIIDQIINGSSDDELSGLQGQMLQIGGDATTGRGHVVVTAVEA